MGISDLAQFRGPIESPVGPAQGVVFRPPEHERGYGYMAPWEDLYAGFPEHCRRSATALAAAGAPVHLRSLAAGPSAIWRHTPEFTALTRRLRPLLDASVGSYDAVVYQVVPHEGLVAKLPLHRVLTGRDLESHNRRKVAYIVLERDRVSGVMASALDRLGQVWVSCEAGRQALISSGVSEARVRVVHMPMRDPEPLLELRGRARPRDVPRFYHIGKWEPRKAQDLLIRAFMSAYGPREAKLTIKTSTPFYPRTPGYPRDAAAAVAGALEDEAVRARGWTRENLSPAIRVVTAHVDEADLVALHRWGSVYLSLSRGEGWDMPAFDAMLAGNVVAYTPSGGPQEFLDPEEHVMVPFIGHAPCHAVYDWGAAQYGVYSAEYAARALAVAASRPPPRSDPSRFAPLRVGQHMLSCLREL